MILGTPSLRASNPQATNVQFTEKISCEQLLLLIDTALPLIQMPRQDLLRHNVDSSLYLKVTQRLKYVNLTSEKSRRKFSIFCEEIYKSLPEAIEDTAQPDHILATIVFTAFARTNIFSCDYEQFIQCALVKKAFHKALSEVAKELFRNYQLAKECLKQKGIENNKLSLSNYEEIVQLYMTGAEFKKLTKKSELQLKARVAFENFMGTLIQIKLPHIAMTLHAVLHAFKTKCFDCDEIQKRGCHYFVPYFINAFGFEKAFSFQSEESDFTGTIALSHQANFFSFLLSAIFEDNILSCAKFNIHTSYSVYDDRGFEQLQSTLLPELNDLLAPTSHITYFDQQQNRSNHRRLDLSGITLRMRDLTTSDSPKSGSDSAKSGSDSSKREHKK